jgi:hypothetical protein
MRTLTLLLTAAGLAAACSDATDSSSSITVAYDLTLESLAIWSSGSADYDPDQEDEMEIVAEKRALPPPIDGGSAFYHAGTNLSDDLWMYFARRVDGFIPNQAYQVRFEVHFATEFHSGCIGTGDLVLIKTGAAEIEPARELQGDRWRMNVDKGIQMDVGTDAVLLGNIQNGLPGCPAEPEFAETTSGASAGTVEVTADQNGGFWVFFGTESAFETRHEIYFTRLIVQVIPED